MNSNTNVTPNFLKSHGHTVTQMNSYHTSTAFEKIPRDTMNDNFSGVSDLQQGQSRPPVPNRNPREAPGDPYVPPEQMFSSKDINSYSPTVRYLNTQTFTDGLRKSPQSVEGPDLHTMRETSLRIDNQIETLKNQRENFKPDSGNYQQYSQAIDKLKVDNDRIKHVLNPNFKVEEGLGDLLKEFKDLSKNLIRRP